VGKTTLSLQISEDLSIPSHFVSADTATLQDLTWLEMQWEAARQKVDPERGGLFIIDEVQKIPKWSSMIKKLWDEDTRNQINLKVMILGSSPWLMQKGLSESLAGRFEIFPITHWSFYEMQKVFGWGLDEFIYFGGYPGCASLINEEARWRNYINDALVETTISRDILLMTQVNKPALLRRLFQLGCEYSGQILSFQKMVGQLQDAGNTTTLSHYLELLTGAGVLTGLSKYAKQTVRRKGSSPKFQVFNTALMKCSEWKNF
jgi:predicted AAA+ superfamily ATPase